jgi:iron complex transport system substrate-binding protein
MIMVFCGCEKPHSQHIKPSISITDYYNRNVNIPKDLRRIVSLSPGITEMIFDLQADTLLVGRTDYCSFPQPQVSKIASVGGISNVSAERIIALRPDLVLCGSMVSKELVMQIERSGIAIVSFPERKTVEGTYETLKLLGKILQKDSLSAAIVSDMKAKIAAVKTKTEQMKKPNSPRPKVYYVVGFGTSGDFSAGNGTYIHNILTLAGGQNVAENARNWSFSRENLFAHQPDYVFIRKEDYAAFIKTPPYNDLNAVRKGQVYPVESALMDCQTPRSVDAIEYISNIIHR